MNFNNPPGGYASQLAWSVTGIQELNRRVTAILENGGGGGSTTLPATYIGYGDDSNLLTGSSNFIYNPENDFLVTFENNSTQFAIKDSSASATISSGGAVLAQFSNAGNIRAGIGDVNGTNNNTWVEVADTDGDIILHGNTTAQLGGFSSAPYSILTGSPYFGTGTASGTGSSASFSIAIPGGYTSCIVQSQDAVATIQSSAISGTTLLFKTSNTPILGTNNIIVTYILFP
jgi:hypothetical protein